MKAYTFIIPSGVRRRGANGAEYEGCSAVALANTEEEARQLIHARAEALAKLAAHPPSFVDAATAWLSVATINEHELNAPACLTFNMLYVP